MKYYENAMKSTSLRRQGNPKRNDRTKTTPLCRKQHVVGGEKAEKGMFPDSLTIWGLFSIATGSSSLFYWDELEEDFKPHYISASSSPKYKYVIINYRGRSRDQNEILS